MAQNSITLTASMRSNLGSLKSIQKQMDTTQERLSTGKKVNSAIDNASSFYQSRALTNRANDLDALLDSMGQGIQTIQAANEGIEAVTSYVEQLKSVANSAYALDPNLSSYEKSMQSYINQFDTIKNEITKLVADSSYQGINLLRGNKLTITFNESRSNKFDVQGQDILANMNIQSAADMWKVEEGDENVMKTAEAMKVGTSKTYAVGDTVETWTAGTSDTVAFLAEDGKWYTLAGAEVTDATDLGELATEKAAGGDGTDKKMTGNLEIELAGTTINKGSTIYNVKSGDDYIQAVKVPGATAADDKYYSVEKGELLTVADATKDVSIAGNYASNIDTTITSISEAIDYLRSFSTELGNNYSIIETRQNFTESLIDVLETGSDNLVLADMNEESANYLALQTRQQLAINSLSLASQSAQAVLSLF